MATAEQKTALIAAFADADTDKDGQLSLAEITAVLSGQKVEVADIAERFAKADENGDGFIQQAEWEAFCNAL